MSTESAAQLHTQLLEKVTLELKQGHIYEALQYVQSFIARKKKVLGQKGTSNAVFASMKLIVDSATPETYFTCGSTAGNLLKWFIEDGAGSENGFKLLNDNVNNNNYCDIANLLDFLKTYRVEITGPLVDVIYNPIHVLFTKITKKSNPLSLRIFNLEMKFAECFIGIKKFYNAFKCYIRLKDTDNAVKVIDLWSKDGYKTEKPIFFARGLLYLLSENKAALAKELLHVSLPYIKEEECVASSLAVWHVAYILTDLANMTVHPRVDKTKVYVLILKRYSTLFAHIDPKLYEVLLKVGEASFKFVTQNPNENASPMSFFQNLLAGPRQPSAPQAPRMDMATIMSMMEKLQSK